MSVYVNEDDCALLKRHVEGAPVASYINAPLPGAVTGQRVVIEKGMMRFLDKQTQALVELPLDLRGDFLVALLNPRANSSFITR